MLTKHNSPANDAQGQIILDVDLAILGQIPARFDEYERQVRIEYAWVAETEFRKGRATVLRTFLQRDWIYGVAVYRAKYEAQARQNLERSLKQLSTVERAN